MAIDSAKLLDYALDRFQEEKYTEALEAFILSYTKGYEREWVLENIYNCYMDGNEAEFQKCYEHWSTSKKPTYENLTLDFVPYREGEYYIYDKGIQNFRGIFSMDSVNHVTRQEDFRQMEFSALAVAMYWDWSSLPEILVEAGFHKIYAVCQDMNRCASFFKIPELAEYAKNIMLFPDMEAFQHYFHEHTSEYLPKLCVGIEEGMKELFKIINQEHEYRLTPEGRNTDNVLLTIAIPTYNRGNLVLERMKNLLQMSYDAEIEIAVSKNGMELYQEEYQQVAKIPDARLVYYDHGRKLIYYENWHYAVAMSHGKYVLFVSDEDDVILEALEHYFELLASYPELVLVRAATQFQYNFILNRSYGKRGLAAFKNMFLLQNYLSGLIVRRKDFIQANFVRLERFEDNIFYKYYPHEWWCALLSYKGDCMIEPFLLIREGDSVIKEQEKKLKEIGAAEKSGLVEDSSLPIYSTYEARLQQFRGIIDFLHWMMGEDKDGLIEGMSLAIQKTTNLLMLAREMDYDVEHYKERVDEFTIMAVDAIDGFQLCKEDKVHLLTMLEKCRIMAMKIQEE